MKQETKKTKDSEKTQKKTNKKTAKLTEELEALRKEKDELFDKLQRVSADYANYQKRAPRQIAEAVAYQREFILKSFLPALDNFEHALAGAKDAENTVAFVKGVQIVHNQMLDIMKSHGIEQIKSLGEKFDPAFHEAMMQRSEPEQQDDIVLEEFQKGYKTKERVLRPSKVIVNKKTDNEEKTQADEPTEQ